MEAVEAFGISYSKTMRKIILPQATKLMLPNLVNHLLFTKDTTNVSAIGLVELFQTGNIIARNHQSQDMRSLPYLVIITLLTRFAKTIRKEG